MIRHFFLLILSCSMLLTYGQIASIGKKENIIIFKVAAGQTNKDGSFIASNLKAIESQLSEPITQLFPNKRTTNKSSGEEIDLSTIYGFSVGDKSELTKLLMLLKAQRNILYAEELVLPKLCYSPSDTYLSRQYQLSIIKAFEAWDIEKGDSSIVIAITDTGIDIDHEDLEPNVAYNYNDPINGIDDDNDGYIDNFRGWDTGDNDNDPSTFSSNHGNNVAGLSAARTDNAKGIAGTGFKCKFLPIKIDTDLGGWLVGAYDGIVYAADQRADIINCSWGSYTYGELGNDIINYATAKGSLVVAAVGNDGRDAPFYPAAYANAFAVGMTDSMDIVRDNSNYGYHLDIMAIGQGMYTTGNNNLYNYNGGTSMASPLVAGAAALVKSRYPNFEPLQIAEHLRNTSDDILPMQLSQYRDKIGGGRLNMFRSVSEPVKPGVRVELIDILDGNDSIFVAGDTLKFIFRFKNYLSPATNLKAKISSPSNSLIFLSDDFDLGTLNTLEDKTNGGVSFTAIVRNTQVFNEQIPFEVEVKNNTYQRSFWFTTTVNLNYINVTNNLLSTTLSSNGRIGYHEVATGQGIGFLYSNFSSSLFEGSLMIGNVNSVHDGFRGTSSGADMDFNPIQNIKKVGNSKADQVFDGIFADENNQFEVFFATYLFNQGPAQNAIIYSFKIKANEQLNDYYAGFMLDWDVEDYRKNKTGFDAVNELAYTFSTEANSPYFGAQLLSHDNAISFGIDNVSGGNNGIDLSDGFSNQEKFICLSNNNELAGLTSTDGNDILQSISYGPFNLEKDSSIVVSFAIIGADSLPQLISSAREVKQLYNNLNLGDFEVENTPTVRNTFSSKVYPNPTNEQFTVEVNLRFADFINCTLYNSMGQVIFNRETAGFEGLNLINVDAIEANPGIYFLTVKANGTEKLHKIVLQY